MVSVGHRGPEGQSRRGAISSRRSIDGGDTVFRLIRGREMPGRLGATHDQAPWDARSQPAPLTIALAVNLKEKRLGVSSKNIHRILFFFFDFIHSSLLLLFPFVDVMLLV